eukprot:TRINITY_DN5201_c0_g1_i1.p1 TRINITY_DN5201_c0_g1~~TRINITY_DN5201_c0_g1_i1.p1  ORF type:complete len:586 (+),score=191.44 TRINITY_DN5201_c0_g1_i1:1510-3267(+)
MSAEAAPQTARVVFVVGGPGAGKGTQCAKIVETFGYVHLSTGDLLRDAQQSGSEEGDLIKSYMAEGKLVPISVVMRLLKNAIDDNIAKGKSDFLIDGFPRNQENIDGWNEAFGKSSTIFLRFVLWFDCPEDVMRVRLLDRGKSSGRVDDNAEAIIKRFKTFQEQSMPIIQYYDRQGLVRRVSAIPPPEEVFEEVKRIFNAPDKAEVVFVVGGPGAGKGTQCERIVSNFGYVHLSTGDLLREAKDSGSEEGVLITTYMAEGKLVPISVVMRLLKGAIDANVAKGRRLFLIDGFPRNQENIDGWNEAFGGNPNISVKFMLYLECPEPVMEQRLLKRGENSGRVDDNAEAIKKRFKTFMDQSLPIIDYFEKQGLVRTVSSVPSPDVVFSEISRLFVGPPQVVFVLGGPGCGKGTQCARIVKKFGYVHLSAGDLLRDEQKSGSEHGELIDSYIREGKIVPVKITVKLLEKAIWHHQKSGKYKFLIDGFPRNQENLEGWFSHIGDSIKVHFCLFFKCSEEVMTQRLMGRAQSSGRADDNMESILKRFKTFNESTIPVGEFFASKNLYKEVDANRGVDEVFADVSAAFESA